MRLKTTLGAMALLAMAAPALAADPIPPLDLKPGPGTRLLVVSPHPDDEVIAAAGLMQRVVAAGGSVRLVMMTSGDAFPEGVQTATHIRNPRERDYRNYGNLRERETIAAMRLLGVHRAQILFLGFPDGGICLLASKYLSNKARAFESPYTGRVEPPAAERLTPGITYRGTDIRREVESIVRAYRPTIVAIPHGEDEHPDHCATAIFVREALDSANVKRAGVTPRVLQFLVHYEKWPDLNSDHTETLEPPDDFPPNQGTWQTLALTPAEIALKQRVTTTYYSQMLVIGSFLEAFERPNELFTVTRPAEPPECWCDARNVATEKPPEKYRRRPTRRR